MPWHKEKRNGKIVVVQDSNGKVTGTFTSEAQANAQLAALYASEKKKKK